MRFDFGTYVLEVNIPSQPALLEAVSRRFAVGKGFAIATVNLDHLVKLDYSRGFRDVYAAHDFVVADGNPIVWLSRIAGRPVELVTGSDLLIPLVKQCAREELRVGLVGGSDEVLEKSAKVLEEKAPGLKIVAKIAPPMGFEMTDPCVDEMFDTLKEADAQLVILALGAPKQEAVAARGRSVAPDMGFVSVGAGLDFLAGTQMRAPRLMRKLALEWLWRLMSDPRRLAIRYAKCFAIFPAEVVAAIRLRSNGGDMVRPAAPPEPPSDRLGSSATRGELR